MQQGATQGLWLQGKIQVKPKIWRPSGSVQETAAEPLPGAKVVINPKSKKKMEISERYQDLLAQVLAGDVSSSQIWQHLTCADAQPLIAQSQPNTVRDSVSEQSLTREQAAVSNLLAADGQRWTWVAPHGSGPASNTSLAWFWPCLPGIPNFVIYTGRLWQQHV